MHAAALASPAGLGCCGLRWYTRRRPTQTRSSRSSVGRAPLRSNLRGPCRRARSVGGRSFSARAASFPRAAQTGGDGAEPGVVVRDEVQASADAGGRGVGSRQQPPPSSANSPPMRNKRGEPKSAFQAPCGADGRGIGVSAWQSSCEGVGRVPRHPQSMTRTMTQPKASAYPRVRRRRHKFKVDGRRRAFGACARQGAEARGGRGCSWGVREVKQGPRRV